MSDTSKTISLVAEKKSPFMVFGNLPKKFRIEITVDTENKTIDTQLFDACENLAPGQEIVTGCDELNEKLAAGYRVVDCIRPRIPPSRYIVEPSSSLQSL